MARRFALVTAVLIAATAIVQAAAILGVSSYLVSKLEGERVGNRLGAASRHIGAYIAEFRRVPVVLTSAPPILRIADLTSGDARAHLSESLPIWRRHVATLFRSILELTPSLQQARFIGVADGGREIVRVVRTPEGVKLVADANLERRAERAFFQSTIKMQAGDIYVSPLGPSLDGTVSQETPGAMMLAATPVFSSSGRLFGIISVSAMPEAWVQNLAEVAGVSGRFMVADRAGDYLHRTEGGRVLQPRLQSASQFKSDWPELAPIFSAQGPDKLTIQKNGHVISASRLKFNPGEPGQFMVLATDSDASEAFGDIWKPIALGVAIALALAALGVIAAYLVSSPLKNLTGAAKKIAEGTGTPDRAGATPEVGELGEALKIMKDAVKTREDSLRNSEAQLRAIVDNNIDGLITIDRQGIIRRYNPACEQIFGYTASEALGQNVTLLMSRAEAARDTAAMERFWRTGKARFIGARREVSGCHKNGHLIDLEIAIAEIKVEDVVLLSGVVRDITEHKRTERLKSEFISSVSHELRTPLTSIMGALGLLRAGKLGELPDKTMRMISLAHDNGKRLTNLVNDILDIGKLEAGAMKFTKTTERLKDVIAGEAEQISRTAAAEGITIKADGVPGNIVLDVDRNRLLQVLANLLSNAVKFSPNGGTVSVGAKILGEKVRISISDEGPGIPEVFRPRIFQKFAQADSSDTRQKGGTGLGLSITKSIVERMGGEIGFDTKLGVGTTFHFDLPARQVEEQETTGDIAAFEDDAARDVAGGKAERPRVLHVENDTDTSHVLSEIIADIADMTAVATLEDAQRLLKEQSFDLVILDEYLEGRDGARVLQMLTERAGPVPRVLIYSVDEPPMVNSELIARRLVKSRTDLATLRAHIIELLQEPPLAVKRSA